MISFQERCDNLKGYLTKIKKAAIAFSGGKDSFFLVKMAVEAMGADRVLALFAVHPFTSKTDLKRIDYFKQKLDFPCQTIRLDFKVIPDIWMNPRDRCYHCKKTIFHALQTEAGKNGIPAVLDGTTRSDLSEYRPGLAALEELRVKSPLKDMGITSREVELALADLGIKPFYLNSSTCLATRFPYGHAMSGEELKSVDDIESFLINEGIYPLRVRVITDGIRIETPVRNFDKIKKKRRTVIDFCRSKGFKRTTLDIEGLKTGSWD